jgi:thiamine transport system permease protein
LSARRTEATSWLLAALPLGFLAAMVAWPLATVAGGALLHPAALAWLLRPYGLHLAVWTAEQALISTALATALGLVLAGFLQTYHFPGKPLLLRALLLPFLTPSLIAALGLLDLFGAHGLTGLHPGGGLLVILANLFFNLPLAIRLCYGGFSRVPPQALEAARSLGSSPWRARLRVTLPLVWPAALAASSLVLLYSFVAFGTPLLLAGPRHQTLEVLIYVLTLDQLRLNRAGAVALLQLLVLGAVTASYTWLQRNLALQLPSGIGTSRSPKGIGKLLVRAGALSIAALTLGPLLLVLAGSLSGAGRPSLAAYAALGGLQLPVSLARAALNTALLALLSLPLSLLLGGLLALAIWSSPGVLDLLSLLPLMVSPVSLAVGYLLLYPGLRLSLLLLICSYALLAFPLVTRTLLPALRSLPHSQLDAARTLGSSWGRSLARVVAPQLRAALRAAAALALATALGEFASTLVLVRPSWTTLAVGLYQVAQHPGQLPLAEAQAIAVLLFGLTLLGFTALDGGRAEIG